MIFILCRPYSFRPFFSSLDLPLGGIHKLRLQEEGGRWSKNRFFVNFYTIENVNGEEKGGQKKTNFVNIVCERPLAQYVVLVPGVRSQNEIRRDDIYFATLDHKRMQCNVEVPAF